MLTIVQSQRTEQLLHHLIKDYQRSTLSVFEPYHLVIPSKVMGDWIEKQLSERLGISAMINTCFIGQLRLDLLSTVLAERNKQPAHRHDRISVPDVALLSTNVMQWQMFGFVADQLTNISQDDQHPLYEFVGRCLNQDQAMETLPSFNNWEVDEQTVFYQRLWSQVKKIATVFSRYLTTRPDWLTLWSANQTIDLDDLIEEKNTLSKKFNPNTTETPEWLIHQYYQIQKTELYLWNNLFKTNYQNREILESAFWQTLAEGVGVGQLPKQVCIFTVQQLPQSELDFLGQLAVYTEVLLLHFNPSQLFWADIVDRDWLINQRIINPELVYHRDYGHTLLARMGKQSRENFAILANFAGGQVAKQPTNSKKQRLATIRWQNDFVDSQPDSILTHLQHDILMLEEGQTQAELAKSSIESLRQAYSALDAKQYSKERQWRLDHQDNSLKIHACHSLQRQLEVLREEIIQWLNTPYPNSNHSKNSLSNNNKNRKKEVSNILILLPNIEENKHLINAIFPKSIGNDGYYLPARITGVAPDAVDSLWRAITGFFNLLDGRFERNQVFDWLLQPEIYEGLQLTYEQMQRGCELLTQAGYIRGFDDIHLQLSLATQDKDFRFSYCYALERLIVGMMMPTADATTISSIQSDKPHTDNHRIITPLEGISMADMPIISGLTKIYALLDTYRHCYHESRYIQDWLRMLDTFTNQQFSHLTQSSQINPIWAAINGFRQMLRASEQDASDSSPTADRKLRLSFVLSSISSELANQPVSSEPTGVITFARFGVLRAVPYELIVMLNLNLTDFPKREPSNHYDLTRAGLPRRGDRLREDDDLGAFLDALLCARDACWLFYNNHSLTDDEEHLPANPVQELIDFLTDQIDWKTVFSPDINADVANQIQDWVRAWLIKTHSALPFDASNFEQVSQKIMQDDELIQYQRQQTPPAPLWHTLYQQLRQPRQIQDSFKFNKPDELAKIKYYFDNKKDSESDQEDIYIALDFVIQGLKDPAKHYLSHQQIKIVQASARLDSSEPLTTNPLLNYQLNQMALQTMREPIESSTASNTEVVTSSNQSHDVADHILLAQAKLPAGANRHITLQAVKTNLQQRFATLRQYTHRNYLTTIIEQALEINVQQHKWVITHAIPTKTASLWQNLVVNSPKNKKHLLSFWLQHLFWQVSRQTTVADIETGAGISSWMFNQQIISLAPVEHKVATEYLMSWLAMYQYSAENLCVLPPQFGYQYTEEMKKDEKPKLKDWLKQGYGSNYTADYCSLAEAWQTLLIQYPEPSQRERLLLSHLQQLAIDLYQPLIDHQIGMSPDQDGQGSLQQDYQQWLDDSY